MPLTTEQVESSIKQAKDFWDQGRVAIADLICQALLSHGVVTPQLLLMLGQVAGSLGEFAAARRYLEKAKIDYPAQASEALAKVQSLEAIRKPSANSASTQFRFHLIKAWGFGFTSDLDHTLGHLLLAEMAGRKPVIHWGQNSLFRDPDVDNAWDEFFEPVSSFKITDLANSQYSFYPAKWSAHNLRQEEINKWEGPDCKTAGVTLLNQPADVTVADFFTSPLEMIPWLMARHPQSQIGQITGEDIEQIYRYLIQKYLKPKPYIIQAVDRFATEHFHHRKVQAVHVRGSDKVLETPDIADLRHIVFETVQADLATDPSLFIFLLTDDVTIFETYRSSFPGRIIATDCLRSSSNQGIHYSNAPSKTQLGFEVLRDTYLAARCDRFIGLGTTNVTNFIVHLKHWPTDALRLASPLIHHERSELIV